MVVTEIHGAAVSTLVYGTPVYYLVEGDTKTVIDAPRAGAVATKLTVHNRAETEQTATLIVAVYDIDGKLQNLNFVSETVAVAEKMSFEATIYMTPGQRHQYFLWNGFSTLYPALQGDVAPEVPTGLTATETTTSTISLSWNAVSANDLAYYKIYRDNTYIGQTKYSSYESVGLTADTSYSYAVTAVSTLGDESAKSVTCYAKTEKIVMMDMSNVTVNLAENYPASKKTDDGLLTMGGLAKQNYTYVSGGLTDVSTPTKNSYSFESYDGRWCFSSYNLVAGQGWGMRFNVNSDFISTQDRTVSFFVDYLDNFTESEHIGIGYITAKTYENYLNDGTLTLQPTMKKTAIAGSGTGKWKTAVVTFTDVAFVDKADFYIMPMGITEKVYISAVGVAKQYEPMAVVLDASTVTEAENGGVALGSLGGYTWVNSKDSVGVQNSGIAEAPDGSGRKAFYLKRSAAGYNEEAYQPKLSVWLSEDFVKDSDNQVLIRVTYYDGIKNEGNSNRLKLHYAGLATSDATSASNLKDALSAVPLTDTKTWKTHEFLLINACFNGGYDGYGSGGDFIIDSNGDLPLQSADETLYISSIEVVKVHE